MTPQAIRPLAEVGLGDHPTVGGKAASLGSLLAAGIRVPDGFVLPVGFGEASPEARRRALADAAAELGDGPFAVRSSAVAEDGVEQSFAGMFESILDVAADDLPDAVDRCVASATDDRVVGYGHGGAPMAVLVQRMVDPVAAGVAFTANPLTGDRQTCVVTAVRGLGDRLVAGAAVGDEWTVAGPVVVARRRSEGAVDAGQVAAVAAEARRIAAARGVPQDVEWALDSAGVLWILQARPMTALPPEVSWEPSVHGAFSRGLRYGEWISEPVTPLFESWLLTAMEERTHADYLKMIGQRVPRPYHVVVNGWYFYTLNWATPAAFARNLPNMLWHLLRHPRHVAGINPATVRHSYPLAEREWRGSVQPRYRAAVAAAEARVEALPVRELPALIDELADLAGESFTWVTALAGAGYKLELNLAQFYRRHLAPRLGGSHLPLVTGFDAPGEPAGHAVASLDWWHAPGARLGSASPAPARHATLVAARKAAEAAAFAVLETTPRRHRAFARLLADAQHLVPLREEQVAELTIAWPVMRRALRRIGEALVPRVITDAEDIYFLTREEVLASLEHAGSRARIDVAARRTAHERQARLTPPIVVGNLNPLLSRLLDGMSRALGATASETAIVSGTPASAGRATGHVRVVRGPDEFDQLEAGEILVAPLTAPAWTPLFRLAAAVVTDVGSAAAHASIIAREYGIPAIVGCGDATARLENGMLVTVDGTTGNVELATATA